MVLQFLNLGINWIAFAIIFHEVAVTNGSTDNFFARPNFPQTILMANTEFSELLLLSYCQSTCFLGFARLVPSTRSACPSAIIFPGVLTKSWASHYYFAPFMMCGKFSRLKKKTNISQVRA